MPRSLRSQDQESSATQQPNVSLNFSNAATGCNVKSLTATVTQSNAPVSSVPTSPTTIAELVIMANEQLASEKILVEQAEDMQEVAGDVHTLLQVDSHQLNDVLCQDCQLHSMQVIVVRQILRKLRQGKSAQE